MAMVATHRTTPSHRIDIFSARAPFSSFRFVESHFQGVYSVRRCFSLARSLGLQTVTFETISGTGIISEENKEISEYFPDYQCLGLVRLGFWKKEFQDVAALSQLHSRDLIGYAIVKHDSVKAKRFEQWHVFEAVFRKYPHPHNCIPASRSYRVVLGKRHYSIRGLLYCQQNGLNKACAHVALRSILSKHLPGGDISFRKINELAGITPHGNRYPGQGMTVKDIRNVLEGLGIGFRDIDYTKNEPLRDDLPYQKFIYSGIESGAGGLLGFHLSGPEIADNPPRHIIPFFGHTFNKDTWVPDAELSYFDVGGGVGYMPSENWTSSFIGHDDNFGPNFCVPRLHVSRKQVDYVVELFNERARYGGVHAEAVSLGFIYSLTPSIVLLIKKNDWIRRLMHFINLKKIVLRAVFVKKNSYLKYLKNSEDWERNSEENEIVEMLADVLPKCIWVIEISLPQLFPANERKIGEVILNPYVAPKPEQDVDFDLFLLARLPCCYFFLDSIKGNTPEFLLLRSQIQSHMPLMKHL